MTTMTMNPTDGDGLLLNDDGENFDLPITLKDRCIRTYNWSDEFANKAILGYRQFIKVKLLQEDWDASVVSPSPIVDKVWHQHILDVKHYLKACEDYCDGQVIGHNPDGGLDTDARNERIQSTKMCLRMFGRNAIDADIWSFDDDNTRERQRRRARKSEEHHRNVRRRRQASRKKSEPITIRVRDQTGEETFFKMKTTTKMEQVFAVYARQKGVAVSELKFLLDGYSIDPDATPFVLQLDDQDQVDCLLHQRGC